MKKIKIKWKNIFLLLIIIIFLICLIISIKNIIYWKIDSNNIEKQVDKLQDLVEIVETEEIEEVASSSDNIEIIKPKEEIDKSNPYWDYIKMKLIDVNFDELKKINSHTKGWIQVNGTNINYPFVQTNDNKYYLTHSFDKSYNNAGWVFLDYRNNIETLSRNTIIYAHSRLDSTMFGSLKKILKNGWLDNTDNYIVKLSTETENTLWQVFSVYHIPTTNDYIQVNFSSNEEFKNWVSTLINRSAHDFKTNVNEDDNILTLSTCYKDNQKLVLHAKLIKKEIK